MTLESLTSEVKDKKIVSMRMIDLRNAMGNKRLGKHIRASIERELRDAGVRTIPEQLPANQQALVRLYDESSEIAKLLFLLNNPTEESDKQIRNFLDDLSPKKAIARQQTARRRGRPPKAKEPVEQEA